MVSEQGTTILLLLSTWILQLNFTIISYLRYGSTWGDWHGGTGGNIFSFESAITGSSGTTKKRHGTIIIEGLEFKGMDGTNYGPYGGTSGTFWGTDIPSGCSVQYISGRSGSLLDAISFHHSPLHCLPNTNLTTTTTEGMNT